MSNGDERVDWARVHHLRGCGVTAADALEQVRAEQAEQGGRIDPPPDPRAASAAESVLTDDEYKTFHAKTCPLRACVEWVASTLGTQPKLTDAPSPIAWNLYIWASESNVQRGDFTRSLWSRLLPSQSDLANEDRFSDDGLWLVEMIERMLDEGDPSRDAYERVSYER